MISTSATQARLDARAREARARREAHEAATRAQVLALLRATLPPEASAWLIGSLAWGGFGERSDVDVVVRGLEPAQAVRLERELARAAQAPVDLLDLDSLPADFRARVLEEGVPARGP